MEQEKDQLQDQQNKPLNEREGLQDSHQSGEDIRKGANQEDQIDQFKENVPEGGRESYPEKQSGTPPDKYDYQREQSSDKQ